MQQTDILIESGTNEVEIAVVSLGGQKFGINVAKIREFKDAKDLEVSLLPGAHESVLGVFDFREDTVPLIHLESHLHLPKGTEGTDRIVVVTEFNNTIAGFLTEDISDIYRLSWKDFKPLNHSLAVNVHHIVGSVLIDDKRVLVLDMEQILGEIYPESVISYEQTALGTLPSDPRRRKVKIIFAEDSTVIRNQLMKILKSVGYTNVSAFMNGKAALNSIKRLAAQAVENGENLADHIHLILTDIEMPELDGLSLCRIVREDFKLNTPVIMFSSLINKEMIHKCKQVGATDYVAKPETERLLALIDYYALTPQP